MNPNHPSPAAEPGPLFASVDARLREWGAERRAAARSADRLVRMLRSAVFEVVHGEPARGESEAS